MTDPNPRDGAPSAGPVRPASFGDGPIDAALADLDDLGDRPLDEHHERLVRAHEALHAALERRDDADPAGAGPA